MEPCVQTNWEFVTSFLAVSKDAPASPCVNVRFEPVSLSTFTFLRFVNWPPASRASVPPEIVPELSRAPFTRSVAPD